jgi:splicing factor 3B subunit 1
MEENGCSDHDRCSQQSMHSLYKSRRRFRDELRGSRYLGRPQDRHLPPLALLMSTSPPPSSSSSQRGVAFGKLGGADSELYSDDVHSAEFDSEIVEENDAQEEELADKYDPRRQTDTAIAQEEFRRISAASSSISSAASTDDELFANSRKRQIATRDNSYTAKRFLRDFAMTEQIDAFAENEQEENKNVSKKSYVDAMKESELELTEQAMLKKLKERARGNDKDKALSAADEEDHANTQPAKRTKWADEDGAPSTSKSLSLTAWDATPVHDSMQIEKAAADAALPSSSSSVTATAFPESKAWDATPLLPSSTMKKSRWGQTPAMVATTSSSLSGAAWDATPLAGSAGSLDATPSAGKSRRWDQTPVFSSSSATPLQTPMGGATPLIGADGKAIQMTPENIQALRWARELDERNRPLSDEELDDLLPKEGYAVAQPPEGYQPQRHPARKYIGSTPLPGALAGATPSAAGLYLMPDRASFSITELPPLPAESGLPAFSKPEDVKHFQKLLEEKDEEKMTSIEKREREILRLLLKIKNGTPPQRKSALKSITSRALEFGASALFDAILPILLSPTLEDLERHLMVKVMNRILFKLDEKVRPHVHNILIVTLPMLIDEDYYARQEGRELISNLAKAAGLATMIATMRPDVDNPDEYVRNTTARAFAVVGSALGIQNLLPFLHAVCRSKRTWEARHTGIKIVQQIAILLGVSVLPYLKSLVDVIEKGIEDENSKVRCITGLALAALAQSCAPYGIDAFDNVLRPLWKGVHSHKGKTLAAFLKSVGYIIPLMDPSHANFYIKEVLPIVLREFGSSDEEMKKIVLKVIEQCVSGDALEKDYVLKEILPNFFKSFWNRRMALDKRNYRAVVDTIVQLSAKVGNAEILLRIVGDLKDENEMMRKMTVETMEVILVRQGVDGIDEGLEKRLFDGFFYAFQNQNSNSLEEESRILLNAFGVLVNEFGLRSKRYFADLAGIIKWRLNNKSPKVRKQAAELLSKIAAVMKRCDEEKPLIYLGEVFYEYLGEEYPDVLASILAALKAVVINVGMDRVKPPIRDLLPRLTPILRNRHEKVQENVIELIGRIADLGSDHILPNEWLRIVYDLLELLKAHKKSIRRVTINTFGYIARAIGPSDVLAILLMNLRVQDRQSRVCSIIAIAVVAEACEPFTVIPMLLTEYRTPELNVQNGVLKALSFLCEYVGPMTKDYAYAMLPLLEDALMDRDAVHRQIACNVVKHLSLGCAYLDREDAMIHLLNYVWPNILETSPHVINAVLEAVEGLRLAVGPARILLYCLQGLFHPSRKVRTAYWKIYNAMYNATQDALVASYPRIEDDKLQNNQYKRHELQIFL